MNIFKTTTFTWWQMSLLKSAVLLIGIAAGATWSEVFLPYTSFLLFVGFVLSAYLALVWVKNK